MYIISIYLSIQIYTVKYIENCLVVVSLVSVVNVFIIAYL